MSAGRNGRNERNFFLTEIIEKARPPSSIWVVFVIWFVPGLPVFLIFIILAALNLLLEYAGYRKINLAIFAELFNEKLKLDDKFSIPLLVGGMMPGGHYLLLNLN